MRIEHYTKTFCDCGAELKSADDWSRHRRQHLLERWNSTPEGRRTLQLLRDGGFKDQSDQPKGDV